ncbi:amidohydrolase family protein [Colidextribacter sp. OB.20]|uniref:metal-dependent hydrolase family protein n=1 Tax=Colidextribacter sp. OB.20 TaxID=2304568 RepID=UPI0013686AAE|nr:amidohydrolase family protein [Colidextribacter sp. OB.20]NBI11731.1 amidohydrolase family protein [Colidextribacter sp. OB.20]
MKTILVNGWIFDAVDGRVKKNGAVILRDGIIEAVLPYQAPVDLSAADLVYDLAQLENACLLPGLIDTHVHLAFGGVDKREKSDNLQYQEIRYVHNGVVTLLSGVTTVRDCGAADNLDVNYKRALSRNMVPGPRTLICAQPIIATGGHCTYMGRQVDGPYEARKATREQLNKMVDFIKIMVTGGLTTPTGTPMDAQLTMDEISAVVEIAHMNHRQVSIHMEGGPALIPCIEAGIDTVEHGIYITREDVLCMKEHGTPYIPTLSGIRMIGLHGQEEAVPIDYLTVEKCLQASQRHRESFQMAMEAGLLIGAGTDFKHGMLGTELEVMVEYGMSAGDALLTATRNAARILCIADQAGTIEAGKRADLLVVSGDPSANISNIKNTRMVFQDGRLTVQDGLLVFPRQYLPEPVQAITNGK